MSEGRGSAVGMLGDSGAGAVEGREGALEEGPMEGPTSVAAQCSGPGLAGRLSAEPRKGGCAAGDACAAAPSLHTVRWC